MEQTPQTEGSSANNTFPTNESPKSSSPLMLGVVIAVLLIAGGWYMMNQDAGVPAPSNNVSIVPVANQGGAATEDPATKALSTQSSSDEVASIDADLKATDLDVIGDTSKI